MFNFTALSLRNDNLLKNGFRGSDISFIINKSENRAYITLT